MQAAFNQFKDNIKQVKELDALYVYLNDTLKFPNDLTNILRAEWVYTISAMDKLIHDLIRIGMIEAFQGRRIRTGKFFNFGVSMDTYLNIANSTTVLPEHWFEQEIIRKHENLSFQDPGKIADALSLIWDEPHKWQAIAAVMGFSPADLTTRLKAIISGRNEIVHEADLDITPGIRNSISKPEVDDTVVFIENLAQVIFDLVKLKSGNGH